VNQHPPAPIQTQGRFARRLRHGLLEVIHTLLMVIAIYTLVNLALPRYKVEGRSMQPVFDGLGDERVIVNRFEYFVNEPERGDIIVLHNPQNHTEFFIKRLIGLPNETITMQAGQVFINGEALAEPYIADLCHAGRCEDREWILGEDQYFVLGDNRNASHDSVAFGPVDRSLLIGRAWIHYWPPENWKFFQHYKYSR
jgi:signal peptidase I